MSSPETARQARDGSRPGPAAGDRQKLGWLIQLYRIALGRQPDPGGLQAHFENLRRGAPLADIAREFLGSNEFRSRPLADGARLFELYAAAYGAEATADVERRFGQQIGQIEGLPAQLAALIRLDPFPHTAGGTAGFVPNDEAGYQLWIAWNEGEPDSDIAVANAAAPPISILVFVDGRSRALKQTIASVLDHGDASAKLLLVGWPSPRLLWTLLTAGVAGARLRLVACSPHWNEASRLRRALDKSRGAYVGLMAPGDRLHPAALANVARATEAAELPDLIYGDEDVMGANGLRRSPWFKTDWDPDAALAIDLTGRGWFARTALLRQAAQAASSGAPDGMGDLQRGIAGAARPDRIIHLPEVLFHRGERPAPPAAVTVASPAPSSWPTVSVIVPTRDRADLLKTCVTGLLEQTDYPSLELIIVDNDSREGETHQLLASFDTDPRVRVLAYPGAFNWGAINNFAAAAATGEVILLLNNDIQVVEPGWLRELASQAMRPEVGVVGATLLYPDHTLQHAGIALGPDATAGHVGRGLPADAPGPGGRFRAVRAASAVTGACLAIRRAVFQELGGIEATGLRVTWSDTDLCLKAWAAGYRVLVTPFARLVHVELATRGSDQTPEAAARFAAERAWMRERWGRRLDSDPYFSPHLDAETGALRLLNAPP